MALPHSSALETSSLSFFFFFFLLLYLCDDGFLTRFYIILVTHDAGLCPIVCLPRNSDMPCMSHIAHVHCLLSLGCSHSTSAPLELYNGKGVWPQRLPLPGGWWQLQRCSSTASGRWQLGTVLACPAAGTACPDQVPQPWPLPNLCSDVSDVVSLFDFILQNPEHLLI